MTTTACTCECVRVCCVCASVLVVYLCVCVSMRALKQQKVAQWHLIYDCSASEVKTLKIFSQTHKIRRTTTSTRQGGRASLQQQSTGHSTAQHMEAAGIVHMAGSKDLCSLRDEARCPWQRSGCHKAFISGGFSQRLA